MWKALAEIPEQGRNRNASLIFADMEFFVNLGDWPLMKKGGQSRTTGPYPIFSWCGSDDTFDIVLPTYDITESTLENMGRITLDMLSVQHVTRLWPDKIDQAFWRGRDARRERLQLIDIGRAHPNLFNVSLTNFFFFRDEEHRYGPKVAHISFMEFFNVRTRARLIFAQHTHTYNFDFFFFARRSTSTRYASTVQWLLIGFPICWAAIRLYWNKSHRFTNISISDCNRFIIIYRSNGTYRIWWRKYCMPRRTKPRCAKSLKMPRSLWTKIYCRKTSIAIMCCCLRWARFIFHFFFLFRIISGFNRRLEMERVVGEWCTNSSGHGTSTDTVESVWLWNGCSSACQGWIVNSTPRDLTVL